MTRVEDRHQGPDGLAVKGLTFGYPGSEPLLCGVDLVVPPANSVAIVGSSGCGKSTLLSLLAGFILPSSGLIRINGTPISQLGSKARAQARLSKIGFVYQFGEMLPELTVAENIALPVLLQGLSRRDAAMTALKFMERVGIEDLANRDLAEISGGQLQRAAIARALVTQPRLVLADEPTGALDERTAASVLDLLLEVVVGESRASMVVVTHSTKVANTCDRIAHLMAGNLLE